MRRRVDPEAAPPTPAELLRLADAAGVDEMDADERRAWLNARQWTSPDHLRADLAQRRAEHAGRAR